MNTELYLDAVEVFTPVVTHPNGKQSTLRQADAYDEALSIAATYLAGASTLPSLQASVEGMDPFGSRKFTIRIEKHYEVEV